MYDSARHRSTHKGGACKNLNREATPNFVRVDSIVTVSFYALYVRPQLFEQGVQPFRPERWETLRPAPWSYILFAVDQGFVLGSS